MRSVFLVIGFFFMNGIASAEELETLLGQGFGAHSLIVQVRSGGCTHKNDFRIEKIRQGRGVHLVFHRMSPDRCYANLPMGRWIQYDYSELGLEQGDEIKIKNPDAVFTIPQETF